MKSVMSPISSSLGDSVLFEHFLDSMVQVHKLKPRDNGFLKLKIFANLFDIEDKGKLSKNDLKLSIYYACLDNVSSLILFLE